MATEQSAYSRVYGGALTDVSTSPGYAVGTIRIVEDAVYGRQEWVYVKNDSGAFVPAYTGVMFKAGAVSFASVDASAAGCSRPRFVGVAQFDIAIGSYAWVLRKGLGTLKASAAGLAANVSVKPVASGVFTAGTVGADDLVAAVGAAIAANANGVAYIAG